MCFITSAVSTVVFLLLTALDSDLAQSAVPLYAGVLTASVCYGWWLRRPRYRRRRAHHS